MASISVIIPLYNGAKSIAQTLDAALQQSRPASEILVIDDGSTDSGPALVQRYSSVRLLRNPEKGANNARVFGIESSQSPYLALLDQDDLWASTHLEKLGGILDEHSQCPAAVGGHTTFALGSEPDWPGRPVGVECFDPGFDNNPVRTLWTQDGVD